MPDLSRRRFLRGSLVAAAGIASVKTADAALGESHEESLCTVLDLAACVGCGACVTACRAAWQETVPDPVDPMPRSLPRRVPIEDWSDRKAVRSRLTPYNFLYIDRVLVKRGGKSCTVNVPRRCMHCENPACANLCPFGSARVEGNGVVRIEDNTCMGGAKCRKTCPWTVPQRQSGVGIYLKLMPTLAGNGAMFKCHRCWPLVKQGKQPRCIASCPQKVQTIGPRSAMIRHAETLARKAAVADGVPAERWQDYVYGLTENGGTNTLYVSPVPLEVLATAIDRRHGQTAVAAAKADRTSGLRVMKTNRGRPHLHRVADGMASEKSLSVALVLAPLFGAAAGLAGLFAPPDGPSVESTPQKREQA